MKGTYRNRCYIAGANGPQRLTVPLVKGKHDHTIIKDIKISYDEDWQRNHWITLYSVYHNSPYFEFYEDDFAPFFHQKEKYLFDLNEKLMVLLIGLLNIDSKIESTSTFEKQVSDDVLDFRSAIHPNPKKHIKDRDYTELKYKQIFEERTGFLSNMSIVDLLFNLGPRVLEHLYGSIAPE